MILLSFLLPIVGIIASFLIKSKKASRFYLGWAITLLQSVGWVVLAVHFSLWGFLLVPGLTLAVLAANGIQAIRKEGK